MKMAHAPPGHHSVAGRPSAGGLYFPEYVVYRGEQAYPEYFITYRIVRPEEGSSGKFPDRNNWTSDYNASALTHILFFAIN